MFYVLLGQTLASCLPDLFDFPPGHKDRMYFSAYLAVRCELGKKFSHRNVGRNDGMMYTPGVVHNHLSQNAQAALPRLLAVCQGKVSSKGS